jgi:hypothetical protein
MTMLCSSAFIVMAMSCIIWSLSYLIVAIVHYIRDEDLGWPFFLLLVLVAVTCIVGVIFTCKMCLEGVQLLRRLRDFNRFLLVKNFTKEEDVMYV